jgi:hypothetical protein
MRQDPERRHFDSLLEQANRDTARLAAQLDIGVEVISSPIFFQYRLNQMMIGCLLMHWHPTIDLEGDFQRPSVTMLSAAMRDVAHEAFQSKLDPVSKNMRFVNLICDAGTVNRLHADGRIVASRAPPKSDRCKLSA